jgi:hypothetical protein
MAGVLPWGGDFDWMRKAGRRSGGEKRPAMALFAEADPGMKGRMRIFALILALVLLFFAAYFQFWSRGARTGTATAHGVSDWRRRRLSRKIPRRSIIFISQNSIVQFYMRTNDVPLESSNVAETLHACCGVGAGR